MYFWTWIFTLLATCIGGHTSEVTLIPVNSEGRYLPLDVYSRNFLNEFYHASEISKNDMVHYPLSQGDAISFVLFLHLKGHEIFDQFPLFYISSTDLKKSLKIDNDRMSYQALKQKIGSLDPSTTEGKSLLDKLALYEEGGRLAILPKKGQWLDIRALSPEISLKSLFSKDTEKALRQEWQWWLKSPTILDGESFAKIYWDAYWPLTQSPIALTANTSIFFPSYWQLKAELLLYHIPFIQFAIITYLLALVCFLATDGFEKKAILTLGWGFLGSAFFVHSLVLVLRSYILARPPVANMLETVLYVPWIAILISLILSKKLNTSLPIVAATISSVILLTLKEWIFTNDDLTNVQAVLNSSFWLTIHVLMVVGSYGALILGGILGHISLFQRTKNDTLTHSLLQCLYVGVALLIPGTILGGIWAAQSWGRFWDWDPKESWAFISSCVYLCIIHAYRFQKIGATGLAYGSIIGLMVISFTWYGVNYILGTGLHSYGFGTGGAWFYYSYLICEIGFLFSRKIYSVDNSNYFL